MPNIDERGKGYEQAIAGPVGAAVQARRKALGLTAVQLAERTRDLGYPITRVTITKIETNSRSGKLDVAEWLVLAAALQLPPALLLLPHYPDGEAIVLPDVSVDDETALSWLAGYAPLSTSSSLAPLAVEANAGTQLVAAVADLHASQRDVLRVEGKLDSEAISQREIDGYQSLLQAEQEAVNRAMSNLTRAKADLWHHPKDRANAVLWDQREDGTDG